LLTWINSLILTRYANLDLYIWSRDSLVHLVTRLLAGRSRNCGSISGRDRRFFSSQKLPYRFRELPNLLCNVTMSSALRLAVSRSKLYLFYIMSWQIVNLQLVRYTKC